MFSRLVRWIKRICRKPSPVVTPPPIPSDIVTPVPVSNSTRQDRLLRLYDTMEVKLLGKQFATHIDWYLNEIRNKKGFYEIVGKHAAVPWEVVGAIHGLEASFDMNKNLMNGQPWTQRTTWVPRGHGPWSSWQEAAVAAFELKKREGKLPTDWTLGNTLEFLLKFNGLGYEYRDLVSPYLWAYTNHYANQGGSKFVSDGKFSRSAVSLQVGAALMLKELGYGK
jgi:lysozyme family protein